MNEVKVPVGLFSDTVYYAEIAFKLRKSGVFDELLRHFADGCISNNILRDFMSNAGIMCPLVTCRRVPHWRRSVSC